MKLLKNFIILLLIFSCSNKSQIKEFENILGADNSELLTSMITDFEENFLKKKYPNLKTDKAYSKYLTELASDIHGNWERPSEKSLEKFKNSGLKEIIYAVPDSIWIVESPYKSRTEYRLRRKYLNLKGEYNIGTLESSIPKVNNEDSLLLLLENRYDINYFGKYREALKSISKKEKFIERYLKMTQDAGMLDPRMIAENILTSEMDFDDYFTKRLIITEIVYRL